MKTFLLAGLLLTAGLSVQAQSKKQKLFAHHFRILDSLAVLSTSIRVINAPLSIQFMEKHTGIIAPTGYNYFGKFDCYKADLQAWHEWYQKRYKK